MKKFKNWGELGFVFGTLFLALGAALMTKGQLGISMVLSPAYLCSMYIEPLSFGTADYTLQGILLIGFFILTKSFSWKHLFSFLSAFVFGILLDFILLLLGNFTPTLLWERILCFIVGMLINAFGVAIFFPTYLPLQVYELFVKGLSQRFNKPISAMKTAFDCGCCITAVALSFIFWGELRGIGVGTICCALFNGTLIGIFGKFLDKHIDFSPKFKLLYDFFAKEQSNEPA